MCRADLGVGVDHVIFMEKTRGREEEEEESMEGKKGGRSGHGIVEERRRKNRWRGKGG